MGLESRSQRHGVGKMSIKMSSAIDVMDGAVQVVVSHLTDPLN